MSKGKLISLEGIEGVGKSSHVQYIRDILKAKGIDVIATREPGGTAVAEAIREVLLDEYDEEVHVETEMLLLFASRVQHVKNKIIPALEQGTWVICDRYLDSTLAYQGGGRGMSTKHILSLNDWLLGNFMPDLTLLFNAPVEVAFNRISRRKLDRIEQESPSFFERTRHEYLQLAKKHPKRIKVVDASKDIEAVRQNIQEVLNNWL